MSLIYTAIRYTFYLREYIFTETLGPNFNYLDDLEPDSGNITDGVTLSTKACDKDFVVFFDKVEATVVGDESGDLLSVLDELDTNTLTDGGVGLLGLDTDLRE